MGKDTVPQQLHQFIDTDFHSQRGLLDQFSSSQETGRFSVRVLCEPPCASPPGLSVRWSVARHVCSPGPPSSPWLLALKAEKLAGCERVFQLLAQALLLALGQALGELQPFDLARHGPRRPLPQQLVQLRQVLGTPSRSPAPSGPILGGRSGHEARVVVTPEQRAQQRLVQILLLRVKDRVWVFDEVHQGQVVAGRRADVQIVLAAGRCCPQSQDHHQGVEGDPQAGAALHASRARPGAASSSRVPGGEHAEPAALPRSPVPPEAAHPRLGRRKAGSMSREESGSRSAGSRRGAEDAHELVATPPRRSTWEGDRGRASEITPARPWGAGGAGSSLLSRAAGGAGRVDEPLPSSSSSSGRSASCLSVRRRGSSGSWATSLRLLRAAQPALPGGLQRRWRRRRRRRPRTLAPVCLSRRVQAFKFPALSAPSPWKPLTLSALPPPPSSPQTTTPPPHSSTREEPEPHGLVGGWGERLHWPRRRRRRRRLRQRPGLCPAGPRCPGKPTVGLPAGAHRRRRRRRRGSGGGGGGGGAWQAE
ncbi:translation initiation factor IF-2-like [Peromyscus californicus insignis]|uniref:translation initiation factor IF-2-like n=1 Tax=Peromyscus californicus insignis TaxID=564181 RepID=UPI0022A716D0|nr:translation initiation factor IF-2-like [Peromyscus californicus insignis]